MTKLKHPIGPGDRFGRLIVLDSSDRTAILCRCDCGTEKRVPASPLYDGRTRSCGCLHAETARAKGFGNARLQTSPGERFGRLVVIDPSDRRAVLCLCDCGAEARVPIKRLFNGQNKSCGCLRREGTSRTHGLTDHPLYPTWQGMWARCTKPTATGYRDYGGRGITVCEPWRDPAVFIAYIETSIGPRPEGLTLDRIDNDGNYEPGNLRWSTFEEQARNRRSTWREQVTCPSCDHTFTVAEGKPRPPS